ncbi:CHAT domain-containing protein [Kibdelosporangium aridum]|uniref:CHAT domain-containing protein n=1 Tax=Kibdelosporangium aridum TaxID=2030 RepID=A0A1Y5XJG8_KIBAR|nr:CHAT domain-containing protein [Kibdelosporangium aridum]SMC92248.1 CHAT domain-containing protein [Kibdelosporangium aridum]
MSHTEALESVERGDYSQALVAAREALDRTSETDAGQVRLTLAWIELERGNPRRCARELRRAREFGVSPARARCLDGLRLCAIGAYEQAVTELSAAMEFLHSDPKWLSNALIGRGVARGYLLSLAAADRDFAAAARILTQLGEHERVATCIHNRGFVALQAGDLPSALELFEQASGGIRAGRAEALIDHASALLAAGMTRDASALLERAEPLLAGRESRLAEAVLAAGYCALRAGDIDHAAREAKRAQELFRIQRRPAWIAAADALALRTNFLDVAAARRVADRCLRWGKRTEAAELLLDAAKVAPELLTKLEGERHANTARLRAIGWLARAKLAKTWQARSAACRAGMQVVTEYAAAMGAGASELAAELAAVAIEGTSSARTVFGWIERQRIVVLPRADNSDLIQLRSAEARGDTREAAKFENRIRRCTQAITGDELGAGSVDRVEAECGGGRAVGSARDLKAECGGGLGAGSADRVEAERGGGRTVGSADHPKAKRGGELSAATGDRRRDTVARIRELAAALGDTMLVTFAFCHGELLACTIADGRVRSHRLGRLDPIQFTYSTELSAALDRQILQPLAIGDRPLVLIPAVGMSDMVWAALPSCAGRPVSVAPSASAWLSATRSTRGARNFAVAGPGLTHAQREVAVLGHATGESTVDNVLANMDGADIVHIAAHGTFRHDAPMFSCLRLSDGPLYGYDLARLKRAPRILVLSACEVARADVFTNVLLDRGGQALIASSRPVPDEAAVDLMIALHQHLKAGVAPATALADAQARYGHLGFSCWGSG